MSTNILPAVSSDSQVPPVLLRDYVVAATYQHYSDEMGIIHSMDEMVTMLRVFDSLAGALASGNSQCLTMRSYDELSKDEQRHVYSVIDQEDEQSAVNDLVKVMTFLRERQTVVSQ